MSPVNSISLNYRMSYCNVLLLIKINVLIINNLKKCILVKIHQIAQLKNTHIFIVIRKHNTQISTYPFHVVRYLIH